MSIYAQRNKQLLPSDYKRFIRFSYIQNTNTLDWTCVSILNLLLILKKSVKKLVQAFFEDF